MIDLKDISRVYQVGNERVFALNKASLHIDQGEFVSIIGPSGSGKSTLMNIIGCLDIADAGEYRLDDIPIEDYTETELAKIRNRKIGFVFQSFNLIDKLTAEENVELPLIYQGVAKAERKERVEAALTRVNLFNRAKHLPTELSGGQQQRVAIARAIVTRPSLILADEPTGNLDSKTSKEIMDIFHELHEQGNTIVLITHDDDVARQASRIVHIRDGKLSELSRDEEPVGLELSQDEEPVGSEFSQDEEPVGLQPSQDEESAALEALLAEKPVGSESSQENKDDRKFSEVGNGSDI